jgi:hypothetical protein
MAAAEVTYGTPVNLTLGEAFADLGIERRNGEQVIRLAVDSSEDFVALALSPEQAELLADALLGLAHLGSCG